jgi:copper chaperone CopZ
MTCGGCATKIESAVADLKMNGVKECAIDLEAATATVTYEPTEDKAPDATMIAKAITEAGFKAEVRTAQEEAPAKPAAS